jgi:hypothetical protein
MIIFAALLLAYAIWNRQENTHTMADGTAGRFRVFATCIYVQSHLLYSYILSTHSNRRPIGVQSASYRPYLGTLR